VRLLGRNTNWGAFAAIVALLFVVLYHFLAPMPGQSGPGQQKTVAEFDEERRKKLEANEAAQDTVAQMTWQTSRDEITPSAMAWVSRQGQANFVDIKAFRPQRTIEADGLDQLNYLVTAEGPFPNVMRFIDAFESEGSLLAIKVVQLSSMNGTDDTVRATIGLVAYQEAAPSGS